MRHMVVYRSTDCGPSYHETDDLDGAVRAVEQLRNSQHFVDARIFSLQEIPIEFKTYYRVEVVAADYRAEIVAAELPPIEPEVVPADPPPVLESVTAPVGSPSEADDTGYAAPTPVLPSASTRFGLFSRG